MQKVLLRIFNVIVIATILAWYGLFLAQKIDLTTADLGRHIKNGEIILKGSAEDFQKVIKTNFYSYTEPNHEFINHHWGSGVVFYLIHQAWGFKGVSIFYILLGAATLWLFFDTARKISGPVIAFTLSIILIPLIASRTEIRPGMFTYFFSGVFFWILARGILEFKDSPWNNHNWLYLLPVLMLIWVNLHVGFFFGILMIGVLLACNIIKTWLNHGRDLSKIINKKLLLVLLLCVFASIFNPNGLKGALEPLNIFRNYGYLIVENQSIRFLQKLGQTQDLHFVLFQVMVIVMVLSFIFVFIRSRRQFNLPLFLLAAGTAFMAYKGIRNFPFFGFFLLPILAYNIKMLLPQNPKSIFWASFFAACGLIVLAGGYKSWLYYSAKRPVWGLGLLSQVNSSAEFFKENKLSGPVFNDYDIGGYLIYQLFKADKSAHYTEQHKVIFVDNRPEAYSTEFFQQMYIPMQSDEVRWKAENEKYNFNAIFFSHRDYTSWAQTFLINRIQDPAWAPVFVDRYNIIFLKRNEKNLELIKKYELPKSMFEVTKP